MIQYKCSHCPSIPKHVFPPLFFWVERLATLSPFKKPCSFIRYGQLFLKLQQFINASCPNLMDYFRYAMQRRQRSSWDGYAMQLPWCCGTTVVKQNQWCQLISGGTFHLDSVAPPLCWQQVIFPKQITPFMYFNRQSINECKRCTWPWYFGFGRSHARDDEVRRGKWRYGQGRKQAIHDLSSIVA